MKPGSFNLIDVPHVPPAPRSRALNGQRARDSQHGLFEGASTDAAVAHHPAPWCADPVMYEDNESPWLQQHHDSEHGGPAQPLAQTDARHFQQPVAGPMLAPQGSRHVASQLQLTYQSAQQNQQLQQAHPLSSSQTYGMQTGFQDQQGRWQAPMASASQPPHAGAMWAQSPSAGSGAPGGSGAFVAASPHAKHSMHQPVQEQRRRPWQEQPQQRSQQWGQELPGAQPPYFMSMQQPMQSTVKHQSARIACVSSQARSHQSNVLQASQPSYMHSATQQQTQLFHQPGQLQQGNQQQQQQQWQSPLPLANQPMPNPAAPAAPAQQPQLAGYHAASQGPQPAAQHYWSPQPATSQQPASRWQNAGPNRAYPAQQLAPLPLGAATQATQQQPSMAAKSAKPDGSSDASNKPTSKSKQPGAKGKAQPKAGGSKQGKGKGKGYASNISFQLDASAPAEPSAKLKQATIAGTLKRREAKLAAAWQPGADAATNASNTAGKRNRAPQPHGFGDNGNKAEGEAATKRRRGSAGSAASGSSNDFEQAPAPANPPKQQRKRTSGGAAATAADAEPGKNATKAAAKATKQQAAAEIPSEVLDVGAACHSSAGRLREASTAAGLQALQQALQSAHGCSLALLLCEQAGNTRQYYSTCRPLAAPQQAALKRARQQANRRAGGRSSGGGARRSSGGARRSSGGAGTATPEDGADGAAVGAVNTSTVVGAVILPVTSANHQHLGSAAPAGAARAAAAAGPPAATAWYLPLSGPMLPVALQLLCELIQGAAAAPCLCCHAKNVLCYLARLGLELPAAEKLQVVDPCVLAWLYEPQLLQGDEKALEAYALAPLMVRHGLAVAEDGAAEEALQPLERLRQQLRDTVRLVDVLHFKLSGVVSPSAIRLEMKMLGVLARLECAGVACEPTVLLAHSALIKERMAVVAAEAEHLVGPINLSSASQLATALYDKLKLPLPTGLNGRGAAKTHTPTNEAALRQLAPLHPLPALVLEWRCMQNLLSKWLESPWAQRAAAEAASPGAELAASGGGCARVLCSWNQTSTATGRLSSNTPNLQAVTKYTVASGGTSSQGQALEDINVRDAFVAPAGKVLLAADYSQVELRLLAHFSSDQALQAQLRQAGEAGDAFKCIARQWLRRRGQEGGDVTAAEREKAKRIIYGIIYSISPPGLAAQLAEQRVDVPGAAALIQSFLSTFPGVRAFIDSSNRAAAASGCVKTLLGRMRPIHGLQSHDYRVRSEAERKVVNSAIQGSAADLIKLAMCSFDDWCEQQQQQQQQQQRRPQPGTPAPTTPAPVTPAQVPAEPAQLGSAAVPSSSHQAGAALPMQKGPPARLIAQIHDELLFECDDTPEVLQAVAAAVKRIMEGAVQLDVPLRVNLSVGRSWGSMAPFVVQRQTSEQRQQQQPGQTVQQQQQQQQQADQVPWLQQDEPVATPGLALPYKGGRW